MSTSENVLPLSCSCSNCNWKLCTMNSKINKNILLCCCRERNISEQYVYTCTTSSTKKAAKHIKGQENSCHLEKVKNTPEKNWKKDQRNKPLTDKKPLNDKIEFKQTGKQKYRLQKCTNNNDSVSTKCKAMITPSEKDENKTTKVSNIKSDIKKDSKNVLTSDKFNIEGKKNDLYSKIEEIYKICCCEFCDCPLPSSIHETSKRDEICLNSDFETKADCLCFKRFQEGLESNNDGVECGYPMKPLKICTSEANTCHASIDKKADSEPLQLCNQSCEKKIDENQIVFLSAQEKESKGIPELVKKKEYENYACTRTEDIEVKNKDNAPQIFNCPCIESPSLDYSCKGRDISETGSVCVCQPDDKEEEECLCNHQNLNESTDTKEAYNCNLCECMTCLNAQEDKDKNKTNGEIRKSDPGKITFIAQNNHQDIRALLSDNLPFKEIANKKRVCDDRLTSLPCSYKDNRKDGIRNCFVFKNNSHEYENILSEFDSCACSPCDCMFCKRNVAGEGLGNHKACSCAKCDCISCSHVLYNNHKLKTSDTNIQTSYKVTQDKKEKLDYSDILYENLKLMKKGEVISDLKTDKIKHDNGQLKEINGTINTDQNIDQTNKIDKNIKQKKSKENVTVNSNAKKSEETIKNNKVCFNLLIPSNSGFIEKSLTTHEPRISVLKKTNEDESVSNIKIYIKLKNMCDNADDYIIHLKYILEKSKRDNEHFQSIVQKIKSIQNTSKAKYAVPRVLEFLKEVTTNN